MLKWFKDCKTLEDVKKLYKALAVKYHPDLNHDIDSTDLMKEINNEYEKAFNLYKNTHTQQNNDTVGSETTETTETPDMFKDIINSLIHCEGVTISIVGSWLWLEGNTYPYKDVIKSLNFKWAQKKKSWYWHSPKDTCKSRKNLSLDEIKNKYGCQSFTGVSMPKLAAV